MLLSQEIINGQPVAVHAEAGATGVALLLHDGDAGDWVARLTARGLAVVEVARPADVWRTPDAEAWVAAAVNAWALARWAVPHAALVGVGVAGHAALRLAFRQAGRFPVVATENAAVDLHDAHGTGTPLDELYDSREACRQDSALLAIRPFRTPPHVAFACRPGHAHYRGNDRLHEKLNAVGVAHQFVTAGDFAELLATFVAEALRQQSRRLV